MRKLKFLSLALAASLGIGLSGCSGYFGDNDDEPPLEGQRLSVLELQRTLKADKLDENAPELQIPGSWRNQFWPQAGGYPNHSMQNLALSNEKLKRIWRTDIGEGSSKEIPLTTQPIIVDGKIFTLDIESRLSAFDVTDGQRLWQNFVGQNEDDDLVIGGGIAFGAGRLFITNGYNELIAANPLNGEIFWRTKIAAPSRAAPTVIGGRVFVSTLDNRLIAFNDTTGEVLWSHQGLSESAGIVGAAAPAANRDVVIAAFSSGELTALRVENGSVAWSDNLANIRRIGGLSGLSDIRGLPVIDKGMVLAISFSDKLIAIDERTGTRLWQREIGGTETPWLAGNHVYVITNQSELVALARDTGAVRWVTKLPSFEDPEDREDPIFWSGPLLAGSRLMVFGSHGEVLEFAPETGLEINQWGHGEPITISPIIANETLYVLDDDGTLSAYQ